MATKISVPYELNPTNSNFTSFPSDGAMGFGTNNQSWFGRVISSKALPEGQQVFGMSLSGSPQLIIGGTDTTKFVGELTIVKVAEDAVRILRGFPCFCLINQHEHDTGFLADPVGICHSQRKRH